MPLFGLLEQEFRRAHRGHIAAGMSLLIALFVHVARLSDARVRAPARRQRPSGAAPDQALARTRRRARSRASADRVLCGKARRRRPRNSGASAATNSGIRRLSIINEHLVREAQRDLVYSGLSIKQIAHGLGFADIAYFSRYFRKQTASRRRTSRPRRTRRSRSNRRFGAPQRRRTRARSDGCAGHRSSCDACADAAQSARSRRRRERDQSGSSTPCEEEEQTWSCRRIIT